MEVKNVPGTLDSVHNAWIWWGTWPELSKMFERIDAERGFRVIIRAEKVDKDLIFVEQAKNRFPSMDARKALVFEIGPFPER